MAGWPQYVATLSADENDDEVIGDVIESIRAHLQMHLPSLDSIKKLVLTLTAVLDKPFADALAKVWAGIAGSNSAVDVGHTGTTVISVSEKAPDSAPVDAIGQSVGSMRTERQQGVPRRGTTRTLTTEVLNVTVLHGTPEGYGRLVRSENHQDYKEKYLKPLHAERTHVHGPNRGTCASYSTDHQNRDGQMFYETAKEAAPAVEATFGHYMAAFVCDLPHIRRALQEALYAYHLDAGTAKLLLGDCISRFLHETPELTPVDVFRLHRMDKAPWDTSAVTTPVLGEETKTSLLSHVIDVDCPKADRTLGVYMERIMTSGSLTSVPPVAVGIFKKYIKDGLVEALPWSELMCVAARDEVLDYAVTAFALDKDYVYGWVGDVAPPRLLLNRFISTVMGNAEHEVPMHNHLDIAHMVAELGNIAAWGCVERAMTKESANQLKTDIEVLMGDASACPATRSQTVSRIRAAARRYQISKKNYTDVEAMQASSGGGVTSTEKFKTAVQRLVCPGNVKKGTGGHLLAHRLIGAAASAMVRLLSVHGTIGVEQLNWRDYDSASYAGRKSYEILRAIHISKYIMYMQTFFARMKSELRPEGSRREYDRKLFVAMESLESAMYAHTKGVWRLSRMFVAIWSHELVMAIRRPFSTSGAQTFTNWPTHATQVFETLDTLQARGFKLHNKGAWKTGAGSETDVLLENLKTYASRPHEFADGTFTDEHWGDGPGKTTSLMAWFVKKVPTRSAGAIAAHIRKLLAEDGATHGALVPPRLSTHDTIHVNVPWAFVLQSRTTTHSWPKQRMCWTWTLLHATRRASEQTSRM
jgi:hypothetical protein